VNVSLKRWRRPDNAAVLLSMVWAALAACVIGAVIYDIASWLGG
jgi:hypothetical protein